MLTGSSGPSRGQQLIQSFCGCHSSLDYERWVGEAQTYVLAQFPERFEKLDWYARFGSAGTSVEPAPIKEVAQYWLNVLRSLPDLQASAAPEPNGVDLRRLSAYLARQSIRRFWWIAYTCLIACVAVTAYIQLAALLPLKTSLGTLCVVLVMWALAMLAQLLPQLSAFRHRVETWLAKRTERELTRSCSGPPTSA
jgi:hypothetical protein